ncbi:uncharacterized protein LOC134814537 isoform X2 [Bolinopsis microptera]|uniref:uncharacterized protein LOC134814537 isoform X2 n=1 Tax=Bolinopsis microptera TaxID=2820187 RepID=UPI003078A6F6
MVVTKSRRKSGSTTLVVKRRNKSGAIRLEGNLSDYLNTKGADVLWGSNIRLTENDLQEILPTEPSPSSSPEKNVIAECAMCNEELTTNHVCREYLERLQPHFSTVPKGGHEITLTQTSEECRKNLSSLDNGIYDEDDSNLFHFNPPAAHIDVIAKTEFDHESSVDNINVSVSSKTASTQSSEKQTVPFSTSWISAVYSKGPPLDLFTCDQYQAMLSQRTTYCYPILTKLDNVEHDQPHSPPPVSEGDQPTTVTLTTEYYHPTAPLHDTSPRPKFVRSVKRLKRDAYFTEYPVPDDHCNQSSFPKETSSPYPEQRSYPPTKKRTIYPTSYKSAEVTKNSSVGGDDTRHEAATLVEPDQPRKKRKYVRRTTKEEQIENGTALWQFLMRKLEDQRCRGWIRWTGNDLEFKVLDQKEAAKQWGLCKKRTKMTFDKFSRSMRFYYSKGILVHNPDKRLTYIFCRQPHDPVYTEMLERVMNTLPPNTLHCTATCIDPTHEHEKIKLLVRKRPKKAKARDPGIENPNSRGDSGSESPGDCGSRSIGLQCGSNQDQDPDYGDHMRGSLIPEYVMPYQNEHGSAASPPYSSSNMTDSGFCSSSPYSDYRRRSEHDLYNSSPMAALIAAASQAVAVPIPGPRVYPSMEIPSSPSHRTTPPPYTPPPDSRPSTPPCGTPRAPQLSAEYTEMMVSAIESGELRYEELSPQEVSSEKNRGYVDYYQKTNDEVESGSSHTNHTVLSSRHSTATSYEYNVESTDNQQNSSSVTILDSGMNYSAAPDMFVPETQLSDSLSTNVPSPTTIPDTQDTTPELSMDETKESTTSESQLTGTVDVVPEMTSSDDVLPQDTDGIFSFNTETSVQVSGTGERSTRISQDSGFCETPSTFNRISKDSDIASQDSQEI